MKSEVFPEVSTDIRGIWVAKLYTLLHNPDAPEIYTHTHIYIYIEKYTESYVTSL
jgi:hypothetical protein